MVPARSAEAGGRQHDVGLRGRRGEERVDGDDEAGAGERPAGQVAVGEVGERVGAEQHQRLDLAVGRGREDAGGVEARLGRARCPTPSANQSPAVVERRPARAAARAPGPCRGRRGRCPGAGRTGTGRRAGRGQRRRRRRRCRRPTRPATAGRGRRPRRPAEQLGGAARCRRVDAAGPVAGTAVGQSARPPRRPRRAGSAATRRRSGVSPVACGASSTSVTPSSTTASRRRR